MVCLGCARAGGYRDRCGCRDEEVSLAERSRRAVEALTKAYHSKAEKETVRYMARMVELGSVGN